MAATRPPSPTEDGEPRTNRLQKPGIGAPRLSLTRQAAYAVAAVLLVLLAVEGAARAYYAVRNVGAPEEPRGYVEDDPTTGYRLKPAYSEGSLRVNSLGFRGSEIVPEKPAGTYRIATLGDSVTFGPHEEECAYPHLLPGLLTPRTVEVINAGVEGYRTDRALVHLERDVLPIRPDLVTVLIGWNDLYQTDPSVEQEQLSIQANPLARLLALSDAAQAFRRLYFLRTTGGRATVPAATLARYEPVGFSERLRRIVDEARSGGADVVVFTWPTLLEENLAPDAARKVYVPWYLSQPSELLMLYRQYQEALRAVAAATHAPVFDAAAVFRDADRNALFKDGVHFSCEGHALLAAEFARQLRGGLVPSFAPD